MEHSESKHILRQRCLLHSVPFLTTENTAARGYQDRVINWLRGVAGTICSPRASKRVNLLPQALLTQGAINSITKSSRLLNCRILMGSAAQPLAALAKAKLRLIHLPGRQVMTLDPVAFNYTRRYGMRWR
jgi:hypothetical protein